MRLRTLPVLFAVWALSYCLPALAIDGEFRVGVGAMLNNNQPYRAETKDECGFKGQYLDASAIAFDVIGRSDLQLTYTYVMCSIFGTEQFVTLQFVGGHRFKYGGGLIVSYTQGYEDWQRDYVPPDPIGPRECTFCGAVLKVGYQWRRFELEARYYRTDFNLYPGHNGAAIQLSRGFGL